MIYLATFSSLDERHSMNNVARDLAIEYKEMGVEAKHVDLYENLPRKNRIQKIYYRYIGSILRIRRLRPDSIHLVDHSFGHILFFLQCKKALHVHDLIPLLDVKENSNSLLTRLVFYVVLVIGCMSSKKIYCVSHTTRRRLKNAIPWINKQKIVVHYNLVPNSNEPLTTSDRSKDIDIILVGSQWYKNHEFTAAAISKIKETLTILLVSCSEEVRAIFSDSHHTIIDLSQPSLMKSLYLRSKVIINYSIDEGFGLTAFEALAMGCCPVLSRIEIHEELYPSSSELLVPLHAESALTHTIARLIECDQYRRACVAHLLRDTGCLHASSNKALGLMQ